MSTIKTIFWTYFGFFATVIFLSFLQGVVFKHEKAPTVVSSQSSPAVTHANRDIKLIGLDYDLARQNLISDDWKPNPAKDLSIVTIRAKDMIHDGYTETQDCGLAANAECSFSFKKDNMTIVVWTTGNDQLRVTSVDAK